MEGIGKKSPLYEVTLPLHMLGDEGGNFETDRECDRNVWQNDLQGGVQGSCKIYSSIRPSSRNPSSNYESEIITEWYVNFIKNKKLEYPKFIRGIALWKGFFLGGRRIT